MVLVVGIVLTGLISYGFYRNSAERIDARLARSADHFANAIDRSIGEYAQEIGLIANAVVESHPLKRTEFGAIVDRTIHGHANLHAITWVPRVTESTRSGYARLAEMEGVAGSGLWAAAATVAAETGEYYPVLYAEPASSQARMSGHDLARFPLVASLMSRAGAVARIVAGSTEEADSLTDGRDDLLLIAPVFEKLDAGLPPALYPRLLGYVIGFYDAADLFTDTEKYSAVGINYAVYDGLEAARQLLVSSTYQADRDRDHAYALLPDHAASRRITAAGLGWLLDVRLSGSTVIGAYVRNLLPPLLGGGIVTLLLFVYLRSAGRNLFRIQAFADDLRASNRELAKEILERSEREKSMRVMQLAIDQSPNGIVISRPDGTIEYVNAMFETITGFKKAAAIGRTHRILKSGFTANEVYADLWRSIARKEVWRGELLNRRHGGQLYWSNLSIWPILEANGELTRLVSVFQDVTEKLRQQENLKLLSHAISQSASIVIIATADGLIRYANRQYASLVGQMLEPPGDAGPEADDPANGGDALLEKLRQAVAEGEAWKGEVLHRTEAGEPYWASVAISRIDDETGAGTQFMVVSEDVTERVDAEAQIRHFAMHDTLTGLANRWQFNDRLQQGCRQVVRQGGRLALMVVDLDDFKDVNDTLGHDVGDKLLREVADRLRASVRGSDTLAQGAVADESVLARIGGDEFHLLLMDAKTLDGVASTAERLIRSLATPFDIDYQSLSTGASIGIAICPDDTSDAGGLMKCADIALYQAKAAGRGTYCFFERSMEADIKQRKALERDLRLALDQDGLGLCLHYQPQVGPVKGDLIACEALLRWQHPQRGPISPAEFIPVAEASGLIVDLGRWVVQQACRQIADWQRSGLTPVPVAVNLSAVQFRYGNLVEIIEAAIADNAIARDYLWVEITETVVMGDTDATMAILGHLHQSGIHIALDDFGTGYSSLGYLTRFPIDKIKLDRSFVRSIAEDSSTQAIVRSIVDLSHRLQKTVTAEGVETIEQLHELQGYGVDEIQGFYFSRPLGADDFARLLAQTCPFAQHLHA